MLCLDSILERDNKMSKKFDFSNTINVIQSSIKDERRKNQFGLGNSLESVSDNPEDFVVLPEWWKESYGILGLPFGKWVQISGKPDAGKTSLSLLSIKNAQEQGYGVIYVETEGKTGPEDLISAGIDPEQVITISTKITEEVYSAVNRALDVFFDQYPNEKLLLVIDSYGNTTSMRDSEIDQTEKVAMVGGHAKSNRLGLSAIASRQIHHDIAVLIVNYSYANLGSVGETNAGGRGLEFFCSLIINASRKAWYERTIDKRKVRAGADVLWKTTKNHFAKSLKDKEGNQILLPKDITLRISGDGFKLLS